jgi:hypothetical protein
MIDFNTLTVRFFLQDGWCSYARLGKHDSLSYLASVFGHFAICVNATDAAEIGRPGTATK